MLVKPRLGEGILQITGLWYSYVKVIHSVSHRDVPFRSPMKWAPGKRCSISWQFPIYVKFLSWSYIHEAVSSHWLSKKWRKGLDFGQYMTVVWRIFKMDLTIGLATVCQKYNKYETLSTLFFLSFLFFISVQSALWWGNFPLILLIFLHYIFYSIYLLSP